MNKWPVVLLSILWLVVISIFFAVVWLRTSWLSFIKLPNSVWDFLDMFIGYGCCESAGHVEIAGGLVLGLLFSFTALLIIFFAIKFRKKP